MQPSTSSLWPPTLLVLLAIAGLSCLALRAAPDRGEQARKRIESAIEFAAKIDHPGTSRFMAAFRVSVASGVTDPGDRKVIDEIEGLARQWDDPTFLKNMTALAALGSKSGDAAATIIGGDPDDRHSECVAVGSDQGWIGSGVFVSRRVILTAKHVLDQDPTRIWLGTQIGKEGQQLRLTKDRAHAPGQADLAALILAEPCPDITVRERANRDESNGAESVLAVGYGSTHADGGGENRLRMVALLANTRANPCNGATDADVFGCVRDIEFVSGGAGKDTCRGDSGGPAYLRASGKLVGITVRPVKETPRGHCGLGGVFVRTAEHENWICDVIRKYP